MRHLKGSSKNKGALAILGSIGLIGALVLGLLASSFGLLSSDADSLNNNADVSTSADITADTTDSSAELAATSRLAGVAYKDSDSDGVRDAEEIGLAGFTVTLVGDGSSLSTVTDETGYYEFLGVANGDYELCISDKTGYAATTNECYAISYAGEESLSNNFGQKIVALPSTGGSGGSSNGGSSSNQQQQQVNDNSISGTKYNDLNANEVQDANETGIANVTISISGASSASVMTDSDGFYEFTGLPAGDYTVCETVPAGSAQTAPATGPVCAGGSRGHSVSVSGGASSINNNFGNRILPVNQTGTAHLEIIKKSIGSNGTFHFTGSLGSFQISTILVEPDASVYLGSETFDNLPEGTFSVVETEQAGFRQILAACTDGSNPSAISLSDDEHVVCVFVNEQRELPLNVISGMKFEDLNRNGVRDGNETGLANWTITLSGVNTSATTTTDAVGFYEFTGLADGSYRVCETLQSGWTQTAPTSGPICPDGTRGHTVTVSGGTSSLNNNFGNVRGAAHVEIIKKSIGASGTFNFTGTLGNFQITTVLVEPEHNVFVGTKTFPNAAVGSHSVSELEQPGWQLTVSGCIDGSSPSSFSVDQNGHAVCVFVNEQREIPLNVISGVKFNDLDGDGIKDLGEPGLENWTVTLSGDEVSSTTQTDAIGFYEFSGVADGTYTVCEVLQEDWTQTAPASGPECPDGSVGHNVTVSGGESSLNNDFGNRKVEVATVIIKKVSVNGTGSFDFTGTLGNFTITTQLVANSTLGVGVATFNNVAVGTHSVSELAEEGWELTSATCNDGSNPSAISLQAGETVVCVFQNEQVPQGSIGGQKIEDINHNGQLDPGEGPIEGWRIELRSANGSVLATALTDANGMYLFSNLPAGSYVVCEEMRAGWMQIFPSSGPDCGNGVHGIAVVLSAGENSEGNDFGNQNFVLTIRISGMKFNDLDGDGAKDADEPGLEGWTIFLDTNNNGQLDGGELSDVTDANGNYLFENLIPGTYRVREVQQEGWTQTTPNPAPITVGPGDNVENVNFGNQRIVLLNSISGMKFNDLDGDGIKDENEPGLEGWTIQLIADGDVLSTTVTDENGDYEFTGVEAGSFAVCEVLQSGWVQTAPASGPICPDGTHGHAVSVSDGVSSINNDFGNRRPPGSIAGQKIEDINHNGQLDPGEGPIEGWRIELRNSNGDVLASVLTDANGMYLFDNLDAGTYVVCEEMRPGWMQIFPSSGPDCGNGVHGIEVVLSIGEDSVDNDFGNQNFVLTIRIRGVKFNDLNGNAVRDANEPTLSGWTIFLDTNNNGQLDGGELSDVTDANGAYEFENLIPGTYRVREVQQAGWTQTTPNPAPITVAPGDNVENVDFGNRQVPGSISGTKFKDLDADGVRDENEPGLFGFVIFLDLDGDNVLDSNEMSDTTDGAGRYSFENLMPGTYHVREVQQSGWTQTTPNHDIDLESGEDVTGVDIGNTPFGQNISGTQSIESLEDNSGKGKNKKD